MSDDHEHDHERGSAFPSFVMMGGPSEEELERRRLTAIANSHEMRDYIENLDAEGAEKMITMIQTVQNSPEAGWYYIGVLAQLLDTKFGKCKTCGSNHDAALAEMAGDGGSTESDERPLPDLLREYNMVLDTAGHLACAGCGTPSVSMEDRMLRPPGVKGCSTCQEKAKWG